MSESFRIRKGLAKNHRLVADFFSLEVEAFDKAVENFDLSEMERLASVAEEVTTPERKLALGKLRLQHVALPMYEYRHTLLAAETPSPELTLRLNRSHQESLDLIEDSLELRRELHTKSLPGADVLAGHLSEATFQALLNQKGAMTEEIAIPSSQQDDVGFINLYGKVTGHDFLVYPPDDPENAVKIQVKTTRNRDTHKYAHDIGIISMANLLKRQPQYNPRTTLPAALRNQNRFESTPKQDLIVEEATEILHRFIKQRRSRSKRT